MKYWLGVDIGGTFTDFTLVDAATGSITVHKNLTTAKPEEGVLEGIATMAATNPGFLANTEFAVHATTLVINAVIERKGAKTGLLTTSGFQDILEMRRHVRPATYDMWTDPPRPLVPRQFRLELTERVFSDGDVLVAASVDEITAQIRKLVDAGIESVAVCLMHSYVNPTHEQLVLETAKKVAPNLPISLSSAVLPEIKEYERTSTTVVNAYTRPLLETYLGGLAGRLAVQGLQKPFVMLHSSGGLISGQTACEFPVRVIESGPVAGAIAAQYFGQKAGISDVLAFDMGGTTAKACLIRDGKLPITSEFEVDRAHRFRKGSGLPVTVPSVDLIEIGAGGGSIARLNNMGLVQVGPDSAGASPGPVCYGLGGSDPTVTDADLILGYLNPHYFLGGAMTLKADEARERIVSKIGAGKKWDAVKTAATVHEVVNESMAAAITQHVVEKGGNPSQISLFAFGGAGPVHAYNLAKKLKVPEVRVPLRAGVLSAVGMLLAPRSYDLVHTFKVPLALADMKALQKLYEKMQSEAASVLREMEPEAEIEYEPALDICYVGQGSSITIPVPYQSMTELDIRALSAQFRELYQNRYGYAPDEGLELVRLRLRAKTGTVLRIEQEEAGWQDCVARPTKETRMAYSVATGRMVPHHVYDRYLFTPGTRFQGPAIIEERESTTIVGVGATVHVDEMGSLVVRIE